MKNFKIMKKISLLMTMLALFVIIFSACEPNSDPDQKPNVEDKIDIDVESATIFTSALFYNYGPQAAVIFPSFSCFYFQGLSGDVTYDPKTSKCTGNGYLVQINQAFAFVENCMPITKDYAPFELTSDGYIKELFPGASGDVFVFEVVDGVYDENQALSTRDFKAQIIENNGVVKFALEGTFNGEKRTFYFEGQPQLYDKSGFVRDVESEGPKCEKKETYVSADVIYYGETGILPLNVIEIVLVNANNTAFANLYCYGSLDEVENVYGKYTVSSKHEVGTMAKGPGIYVAEGEAYAYPSFLARNYSETSADYYVVESGSISIEEGKISFDLTSLNGSKLTTVYEGKINVKPYEADQAPKKAPAVKNVLNATTYKFAPYIIF